MALKGWYELFKLCLLLLVLVCQRQAVRGQTDFQPDGTPEPASMQTEKCSENEAIESEISSLRSRVSHLLSVLRQFKESLDVTPPPATTQVPDYECQRPCLRIYVPVCGSDNKTYPNHCIFEIAQCMDETLTASAGECPGELPDQCANTDCDELPCPEEYTFDGHCCPACPQDWDLEPCDLSGTCEPDLVTVIVEITQTLSDPCADADCDELPCPEDVQYTFDGGCCPACPQDWGLDRCPLSGTCEPDLVTVIEVPDPCADTKCYELDCPEDRQHTYDGECCPQCPEDWGLDPCHWTGTCFQPSVTTEAIPPRDCSEVDNTINGVYQVSPDGGEPVSVYCDFVTKHGPWTVIQRRSDGSVDFHQKMAEYQAGFGNLEGEFWLGLDNIYKFVSTDVYQLRIDLTNYRHVSKHATYSEFAISDESDGYRLHLGKYSGNARDSLSYHKGMQFTTRDVDRDEHDNKNCARFHKGAWWFKRCFRSNLNGRHRDPLQKRPDGIIWAFWRGYTETIPFVEMKIQRPL